MARLSMTTLKTSAKLKVVIVCLKRQLYYHYKNWKEESGSCAAVLIRPAKPASSTAKIIPVGLHSGRSGDSQTSHARMRLDDRKR